MKYKVTLKGLHTPDGTISIRALKLLVDTLSETAERGLRLAIQGESVKSGPLPGWLVRSLDFTITGLQSGSTTLVLEAPKLGETATDQIRQQDLWYSKPTPDDTAISLVSRSVRDVIDRKVESNAYDKGVLEGLLSLEAFFKLYGEKLVVNSMSRRNETFTLSSKELEHVRELKSEIPEPITLVISGKFDVIQHSTRKFHLALSDGQVILGTIDPDILNVEDMRQYWGTKVTIKGTLHFHPGRKIRLLEAQSIKVAEKGEEVFERLPAPAGPLSLFDSDMPKLDASAALHDIWGKWPGDESIEELLAALTP